MQRGTLRERSKQSLRIDRLYHSVGGEGGGVMDGVEAVLPNYIWVWFGSNPTWQGHQSS
jgi:hypothetical protein